MGGPMAVALATKFDTVGYDVVAKPYPFMGDSLDGCEVIFTVVRDQAETDLVLSDVLKIASLHTLVICSTLSPVYVKSLRARVPAHIDLVDAPMSGAAIAAQEQRLSFMLGGDAAVLDRLQPLLDVMGTKFHRMGDYGAGMTAKVCNNLVAASSTAATRTALAWAAEHGLDRDALLKLMHDSSGQTWLGSNFDAIEFAADGYADDNTIGILAKDVTAAKDAAPAGGDTTLADAIIHTIRNLKPLA